MTEPTITDATIASIRDWVVRSPLSNVALAALARVDEKVIRQVRQPGWNPRAETLRKLENLIPSGWHLGDPIPGTVLPAEASGKAA